MDYSTTPGTILREYFIAYGYTQKQVAIKTGISPSTISRLVNNKQPINESIAIKLTKILYATTVEFWLCLNKYYQEIKNNKNIEFY